MSDGDVLVYAMGDRQIQKAMKWDHFQKEFDPLLPTLRQADIRYQQIETAFSDRPVQMVGTHAPLSICVPPRLAETLKYVGIDVGSPNGNHNMEYGRDAMLDTIDALEKYGVRALGVGKNITEARKPVILERKGTRVAFLAYNSAIRPEEEADAGRAGVVPMRVHTSYEQVERNQPGMPPVVHTFPYRDDLAAMKDDIQKAKQAADIVVACFHFGIHYLRAELAEYQKDVAHAAIDAGADVIVGTHPHVLKAIEVYKGKVIFYSLGDFGFDTMLDPATGKPRVASRTPRSNLERIVTAASEDRKKTGIASILVSNKKVKKVSFLPVFFQTNENGEQVAERLHAGTKIFDEVVNYQKEITKEAGIDTKFEIEGDELVIVI